MRLHIGYLVQQFPPEVGAGPARVSETARHWIRCGARVTVFTGMPNRPQGRIHPEYRGKLFSSETYEGMQVYRSWLFASPKHGFARTLLNNVSFMATAAILGVIRCSDVDVLIASSPPFFVHVAGWIVAGRWRLPLVLEVRDLWPDYLDQMRLLRPRLAQNALFGLERFLLRRAAHVVAVTESFRTRLLQKGVSADRVSVVPNGVDTSFYRADVKPLERIGSRADERRFVVGYLGNFGASQRLETVVDAAALLERRDADIRFVLVGDGTEQARVVARIRETGVRNLVIAPPIPKADTPAFYAACDACIVPLANLPVLQETLPSKIFEVMACGKPVVASLAGEGAKIVHEADAGVTVPPGDPAALAEALTRLRELPAGELRAMGVRGRAYVTQVYSRAALADRYLETLRSFER